MLWLDRLNPGTEFRKYFEVVVADSEALRNEVYRIRHKVYCEELGFEARRGDELERDDYDEHSRHLLLRSVKSGVWVGCIRLVLCRHDRPTHPFPLERTCASTIDRRLYDPETVRRHRVAEVSRLAVIRAYRRRKGEESSKDATAQIDFGTAERPRFPHIQLGLYLGAIALAHQIGMETLILLTEPRLAGHFKKLGFPVRQMGGPIDHRGTRVPSMANVTETVTGLRFFLRPLYRVVAGQVRSGLEVEAEP